MAVELVMPRLSESMEQGTIVSWLVADGAPVARGQEIAEIETDKATLPYEAPEAGILRILVPDGTTLALGAPIGLIDDLPAHVAAPVIAPVGGATAAQAVDLDPPTDAFDLHPDLFDDGSAASPAAGPAPTASASGGGQEWSPAWGPQPRAPQPPTPGAPGAGGSVPGASGSTASGAPQRPVPPPPLQPAPPAASEHHADEGETTEFAAIDPGALEAPAQPGPAQPAAPVQPAASAPQPPVQPAASAPQPPVQPAPPAPPAQPSLADVAATPWVATPTPAAGGVPVPPVPAAAPTEAAPDATEEGRYAADELIAPQTLAPRPPTQQPAPAVGAPRVIASPVARRLAGELGIDLATLTGTGPEGRIVRADVEAAQAEGAARPPRPASATPPAASEFTPPVDDARAAAPIPEPEVEVAAEPEVVVEPEPEVEPEVAAEPGPEVEPEVAAEPEPEVEPEVAVAAPAAQVAPEVEAIESPEPTVPAQPHDAADVAAADAEAAAEAAASQVLAQAADEARSIDEDDEGDQAVEPVADAAPEPVAEARVLPAAQPGGGKGEPEIIELTRQQQTVARRMAESKATIPDFHTTVEVDAAPLLTLRADLRATRPDLAAPSVNDLLVKAVAIALRAFPRLNGGYKDGRIEQYPRINVGIATESNGALVVPVIHDADALSVSQIAARTDELLAKAADGGLRPPDIASATFTVSNLGMHGVDEFTAVITPGQAAILTAGAITERPVVRGGAVVAGQTLRLTLTTDHRAVYGLQAAEFLGRVRQLVEHPSSLLA